MGSSSAVRCPLALRRSLFGAFILAILAVASLPRPASADPLPYVGFAQPMWEIPENGGSVTLTITLSAPSAMPVSVDWSTVDGSATSAGDNPNYVTASGTATFAPGQTMMAIQADGRAAPPPPGGVCGPRHLVVLRAAGADRAGADHGGSAAHPGDRRRGVLGRPVVQRGAEQPARGDAGRQPASDGDLAERRSDAHGTICLKHSER